jgi:N utilization substance protein B
VVGTLQAAPTLDGWIAGCAPEWPVDELAVLDRNILRLALWEFRVSGDTPVKVAINEAVELAKRYSSDNASRFVNGVLGTLAEDR